MMDGMGHPPYFWIMTVQWNAPVRGTVTQTFQGEITPHEGATRRGLTTSILDHVRQSAGIQEGLPVVLFFSLEPNKLGEV